MLSNDQFCALRTAADSAKQCESLTGLPCALTVSQWALESGWGKYSPGNNCFGIKVYAGCYGVQTLTTHEFVKGKSEEENLQFATFPTLEDCFAKHAQLITQGFPYATAWASYRLSRNLEQLVRQIAPMYAPGNPTYADTVLKITRMPEVWAATTAMPPL